MNNTNKTIEEQALATIMAETTPTASNPLLTGIMDEALVGPLPAGVHTVNVEDIKPVSTPKGAMLMMKVKDSTKSYNVTLWIGSTPEEKAMFDTTKYYLLSQTKCQTLNELLASKASIQVLGIPSKKDPRYINYSFSSKFIEEFQG